jgi:hypothetical protein
MTTKNAVMPEWEALRTDESREVEKVLGEHFDAVSVYRYNSASLRVRIVDARFRGLTHEQRDDLVEPLLSKLDRNTQADIMNLYLLYPGEADESSRSYLSNFEFEHPSESLL